MSQLPSIVRFPFPFKGLVQGFAASEQPEHTTPLAQNCRVYDPLGDRRRGGQRPGTVRYFDDQIEDAPIQGLGQVTRVLSSQSVVIGEAWPPFPYNFDGVPDGTALDDGGLNWSDRHQQAAVAGACNPLNTLVGEDRLRHLDDYIEVDLTRGVAVPVGDNYAAGAVSAHEYGDSDAEPFVARVRIQTTNAEANANAHLHAGLYWRGDTAAQELVGAAWYQNGAAGESYIVLFRQTAGITPQHLATVQIANADNNWHTLEARVNGDYADVLWDGALVLSGEIPWYNGNDGNGFFFIRHRVAGVFAGANACNFDDAEWFHGLEPSQQRELYAIAVADGNLHAGSKGAGMFLADGGTGAFSDFRRVQMQEFYTQAFLLDGGDNMQIYDPAGNAVTAWTATAGALPGSAGDRPQFLNRWAGRLVLGGVQAQPHEWFMTRVADAQDFDYSQDDLQAAVTGTSSGLGEVGDVLTAIIPYREGPLLFGCLHEIWILTDNPADRGGNAQQYQLMDQTGIRGPRAYCFDPLGVLYFLGTDGLYRMYLSGLNVKRFELLSGNRLDKMLRDVNWLTHDVLLAWDPDQQGVHIWITPIVEAETEHLFWDRRTGAFVTDIMPTRLGPTAAHFFKGDDPAESGLIFGGRDGYVYQHDAAAKNDDGEAIVSRAMMTPIIFGGGGSAGIVSDVTGITAQGTDSVDLIVRRSDNPEDVPTAGDHWRSRWRGAGIQPTECRKAAGRVIALELSNDRKNETWALEALELRLRPTGTVRKRRIVERA